MSQVYAHWGWKAAEIAVSCLIPISVVLIGFILNSAQASRDERANAEATRVAKFSLIPAFLDALTGQDTHKKELAIRTVTAILGSDGETLLSALPRDQVAALDIETQEIVKVASNARAEGLVTGLFDKNIMTRLDSYRELTLNPPNTPTIVPLIIERGLENTSNPLGMTTALNYLASAPETTISGWNTEISDFLAIVQAETPDTQFEVQTVKDRLNANNIR